MLKGNRPRRKIPGGSVRAARRRDRGASPRKIRVLFVCAAGQESSLAAKHVFEGLLRRRRLLGKFEVDYTGYLDRKPGGFEADLRRADVVVPMLPSLLENVPHAVKNARAAKKLVDVGFTTIASQYQEERYAKLLEHILRIKKL